MKPSFSTLTQRQHNGLIEQYESYLDHFWNDPVCARHSRPLGIVDFYESGFFEMPPTEEQIQQFRYCLSEFIKDGWHLYEAWKPELEMWLDREQIDKCMNLSFDEWLYEFAAIDPEQAAEWRKAIKNHV